MNAMQPTILTVSGRYFNLLEPEKSVFSIFDIAHALAHICRFTGHTRHFYSVAQHSVHVSRALCQEYALAGLLHDAAEAFIGDVSAPLKALVPEYRVIEKRIEAVVLTQFGLPAILPPEVKAADIALLHTERRDLMPEHERDWTIGDARKVLPLTIVPVPAERARRMFLDRFFELGGIA